MKRLTLIGSILLCVSVTINCIQCFINIKLANQKDNDLTSLEKYRTLQSEQIEYVKNRCYNEYSKYGPDGTNDSKFKQMEQIAFYQAPRYVNVDSKEFYMDLIFDYLQSICFKPVVLLLGSEDIYGDNLQYFSKWGYFHFDDSDFDGVRW